LLVELKFANSRLGIYADESAGACQKHGIKTTIPRAKFSVKFDHGELYEVNSSCDVRDLNILPHGTLS